MDKERILLYPMSHDMIIGSTGVGKTTVIYDNLGLVLSSVKISNIFFRLDKIYLSSLILL